MTKEVIGAEEAGKTMARKEYYGLTCSFCGFQSYDEKGLFSGSGVHRDTYRCADCGTTLCEKCINEKKEFTPVGSTFKAGLGVATMGASLLFTGIRKSTKLCLKCNSEKIKKISSR